MLKFLSKDLQDALSNLNLNKVYEVRLRAGKPLFVNLEGEYRMLGRNGLTAKRENAYIPHRDEIEDALYTAGDFSVYSVEEQIRRGFLTTKHGIRIGLAGRYVFERGQPITVRDVTSLCIRIPHNVQGTGNTIYRACLTESKGNNSILLMSLPGRGKTTALREICRLICEHTQQNVLVCDERGELSFGELGETCDVLSFADKKTAFESGIRALRPDVIVTDELTVEDLPAVRRAISSGVTVLASAHVSDEQAGRAAFGELFGYYVLFEKDCVGRIEKIFDGNWMEIPW